MHCKSCIHKKPHLVSATGKVYWMCEIKNTVVHNLDKCKDIKGKK